MYAPASVAKTKAWIALVKIPSHMTATGTMKATSDDTSATTEFTSR
jgi:hypothetical protein